MAVPEPVYNAIYKLRAWLATNARARRRLRALCEIVYTLRRCPLCGAQMRVVEGAKGAWLVCDSCNFGCPLLRERDWKLIEQLALGQTIGLAVLVAALAARSEGQKS